MATPCSSSEKALRRSVTAPQANRAQPPPATRPFVLMNLAITADGCIATTNRRVASFGSRNDRRHLFALRAGADAILCGARTVRESPVDLNTGPEPFRRLRFRSGLTTPPLRVVVSRSGRLPAGLRLFQPSEAPLIVVATTRTPRSRLRDLESRGARCGCFGRDEVDLAAALRWLRKDWSVRRLVVEGGGQLNAAMLKAGLVDELQLTLCPFVFGGRRSPSLADGTLHLPLADAYKATLRDIHLEGQELFLRYTLRSGTLGAARHQPKKI